mmetsp:Transcript_7579/g.21703  ORF Transcript_7579/g.21703 Transcript_7579/m.21703 type:complete len:114 (+) Transcript_7579:1582-1923(+)
MNVTSPEERDTSRTLVNVSPAMMGTAVESVSFRLSMALMFTLPGPKFPTLTRHLDLPALPITKSVGSSEDTWARAEGKRTTPRETSLANRADTVICSMERRAPQIKQTTNRDR